MLLLHYIIPLALYYFFADKIMIYGLLLGNLIDLDHLYYRIIGKTDWFQSACPKLFTECSFNFYPLHNVYILVIAIAMCFFLLSKNNKKLKFIGFLAAGIAMHLMLDLIAMQTGFFI